MSGFTGSGPASSAVTPYVSGQYFAPDGNTLAAAGVAAASGTICLAPGIIRRAVTLASLCVRLTTAAASGNVQLALYAADPVTNKPTGAALFTSASQSTAAAGVIEVPGVNYAAQRGLYWLGRQVDTNGAAAVFAGLNASGPFFTQAVGLAATTNFLQSANDPIGYTKAGAYGTWPIFTGTGTGADGLVEAASGGCPFWGFKTA